MNPVQERVASKVFAPQDFVLWHYRTENRWLPIPGVVVRQEVGKVIIRVRIEGTLRELAVDPDELVKR